MGVPGLYHYFDNQIVKRSFLDKNKKKIKKNNNSIISILYIDFNYLIHMAIMKNAIAHQPVSEAELQMHIAGYVTKIVTDVCPTEKVFISVDGLAPEAKFRT